MQGKPSEITGELHFQAPRSISELPEYGNLPGFILQHNCIIALCPLKFPTTYLADILSFFLLSARRLFLQKRAECLTSEGAPIDSPC